MNCITSRLRSKPLLLLAACLSLTTSGWVYGQSANCVKTFIQPGLACKSHTAFSVHGGPPPIPICPTSVPVIQIDSIAKCNSIVAGPVRVLRCGISSDSFSYTGGGFRHDFSVRPGYNWQSALNGSCSSFSYIGSIAP